MLVSMHTAMIRIHIILCLQLFYLFSYSAINKSCHLSSKEKIAAFNHDSIIHFKFYDNTVNIKIKGDPATSPFVFISLHDAEKTGQRVVLSYIKKNHAAFIHIENNKQRLIRFNHGKNNYVFDPNRIFSKKGIRATLKLYGNYSRPAAVKVKNFASVILHQLARATTIIAMHNNSNGNYSLHSYLKGGKLFKDAKLVNQVRGEDADDFFLTNSRQLFKRLKAKNFNIVLQNNRDVLDDGSLSVYYRNKNKRYINIEAQKGHFSKQAAMLRSLMRVIN